MSATGTFTRQIKKSQTEQVLETIAQQLDFNSLGLGKISLRAECLIQLLIDKGVISQEEYENEIKKALKQMNISGDNKEEETKE